MNLLSSVQYYSHVTRDTSLLSQFDAAADICSTPIRWLGEDLFGKCSRYKIIESNNEFIISPRLSKNGIVLKIIRCVISLFLSLPALPATLVLRSIAFINPEIRLMHKAAQGPFTEDECKQLAAFIQKRKSLVKERQGCDPSCSLSTIASLLCYLVFKKKSV
ncbi:MAG: hypothetical protein H0W88_09275 [Parachlamydiaceae bacterium]|nr:hypothetical protein [Parachlamydiaceae bacterium]